MTTVEAGTQPAGDQEQRLRGAQVVARALRQQGVQTVFGVYGIPMESVMQAVQQEGMAFINTRHEQAAAFGAQCLGYLTRSLGVCMTVSGPGMTNAVSGMANAQANGWPLLVISGGAELSRRGMGAFEEMPQIEATLPYTKWRMVADRIERVPQLIEEATRAALYGRPGAAYLELPGDIIDREVEPSVLAASHPVAAPPRPPADPALIDEALALLRAGERPLVIFGKGAAYAHAEDELRRLIDATGLPWLSSPMGKGLVPDDNLLSVAACRTYALQHADTILLVGARLNWIMHFGLPPRFAPGVKVIHVEIAPEEIGRNVPAAVGLVGDARAVVAQFNAALQARPWRLGETAWTRALEEEKAKNVAKTEPLLDSVDLPMNYYRMLRTIRDVLPRDAYVVAEGASTMDISRQVLNTYEPRHRIDAGTLGTMGVGPAYAIATQLAFPEATVLALEGDSAFGFSGMEVELATRYRLPIVFVVVNNNGYGGGVEEIDYSAPIPPNCLTPGTRHDRIMEAFGGLGLHAETPEEFEGTLRKALMARRPTLIDVRISSSARRRAQRFGWLSR